MAENGSLSSEDSAKEKVAFITLIAPNARGTLAEVNLKYAFSLSSRMSNNNLRGHWAGAQRKRSSSEHLSLRNEGTFVQYLAISDRLVEHCLFMLGVCLLSRDPPRSSGILRDPPED